MSGYDSRQNTKEYIEMALTCIKEEQAGVGRLVQKCM